MLSADTPSGESARARPRPGLRVSARSFTRMATARHTAETQPNSCASGSRRSNRRRYAEPNAGSGDWSESERGQRMAGRPIKNLFPDGLCGAKNRRGEQCKIRLEVFKCKNGAFRCRFHGGLSTGARTPEGKERALKAMREGWLRWRERRKYFCQA